jgi:hypothetical protein
LWYADSHRTDLALGVESLDGDFLIDVPEARRSIFGSADRHIGIAKERCRDDASLVAVQL